MELENKYFVLKGEDIGKFLTKQEMFKLSDLSQKISEGRRLEGKHDNEYLVLNLEDQIDVYEGSEILKIADVAKDGMRYTVKDLALPLINSIIKTED